MNGLVSAITSIVLYVLTMFVLITVICLVGSGILWILEKFGYNPTVYPPPED